MRKHILPIIIGLVLLIIGSLICNGVMKAVNYDFSALNIVQYETESYEISDEFQSLRMQGDTLDIELETTEDGKCEVILTKSVKGKHTVSVKDDVLTIKTSDGRDWYEFFGVNTLRSKAVIRLPKNLYDTLDIKVSNGRMILPKDFAFENVLLQLDAGDIECQSDVNEAFEISLGTGAADFENLHAKAIKLTVAAASIDMEKLTIDEIMDISINAGAVLLRNIECGEIQYRGGSAETEFEHVISKGDTQIKNTSGDVCFEGCDAKLFRLETTSGDVEGTILSDKVFRTSTVSGDIKVPDCNAGGDFEINTVSGDIRIKIERE